MREMYFVDYNQNIYDSNGNVIGRIGNGYIVDRTRSDVIYKGEELGKFINIRNREEIEKYKQVINKEINKDIDELEVGGLKRVTKEENGMLKNYIVTSDGHIYDDNNSFLNFNEKRKMLLTEWLDDPIKSSKIASMTPDELDEELINAIKLEYKEYYFDDANELSKEDEKNRLAREKAEDNDGRVNGELGIVANGVNSTNEFSTVEERNGSYSVVNPTVVSDNLKTSDVSGGGDVGSNSVENSEEEVQSRDIAEVKYYYLDTDGNVYDSFGNMLEGVIPQYLIVDEENNLWYQNQKVGVYGGTLDDLAQQLQSTREKANVRTLRKENNAGFGQIIVVTLVLICLLLFVAIIGFTIFS